MPPKDAGPLAMWCGMSPQALVEYWKSVDWHTRHRHFKIVMRMPYQQRYKRAVVAAVMKSFAPDEMVIGKLTGRNPRVGKAIALPDRMRGYRAYRQLTIKEVFMSQLAARGR